MLDRVFLYFLYFCMKKRILIIEDDKDLQKIYKLYFEKSGLTVYLADDWLKGLTQILEISPDIILLDVLMPQMNGIEVLETIQTQSSIKTPIVVCSSLKKESDIKKIYQFWAALFINKLDFKIDELVQKVLSCLR
jgi:DNA-binding response OmpR family regulator